MTSVIEMGDVSEGRRTVSMKLLLPLLLVIFTAVPACSNMVVLEFRGGEQSNFCTPFTRRGSDRGMFRGIV